MHFIHKNTGGPSSCTYLNAKSKSRGACNDAKHKEINMKQIDFMFVNHKGEYYQGWDK